MAVTSEATMGDHDVREMPPPVREHDGDAEAVLAAATELAYELAESGPARIEEELVRFVQAARRHGADAWLGSIVLDRSQPDVARQRAFAAVHRQVARQVGEA
jgi:hypothetical protein